jgi:hypothetical protein
LVQHVEDLEALDATTHSGECKSDPELRDGQFGVTAEPAVENRRVAAGR